MTDLLEVTAEYRERILMRSQVLVDWMKANNMDTNDAIPILAFTVGVTLKLISNEAPEFERAEYLEEGIEIACGFVRAGAETS